MDIPSVKQFGGSPSNKLLFVPLQTLGEVEGTLGIQGTLRTLIETHGVMGIQEKNLSFQIPISTSLYLKVEKNKSSSTRRTSKNNFLNSFF